MVEGQSIVTLTTDFGSRDGYVGAMKGIIATIAPHARLVDITHAISPQDVYQAAFCLHNAVRFFPKGTVHLAVVDPGVGTSRRPLAVAAGGMMLVGPDNGIFTPLIRVWGLEKAVETRNVAYWREGDPSCTFHGRDIFAPVAAHLAAGVPMDELGPRVADLVSLSLPTLDLRPPHDLVGEVIYLDHFGNAITNLGVLEWKGDGLHLTPGWSTSDRSASLEGPASVQCGRHQLSLHRTYGEVSPGTALALIGSGGLLEVAVRNGNAGEGLGIRPGDQVVLRVGQIRIWHTGR